MQGSQPEPESREKSLERQIRAFHWVRLLAEIPRRVAGGDGEREAAKRVLGWLHEIGFAQAECEGVASRPRPGAVLALYAGLGALGCLLPGALGFLTVAFVTLALRRELRGAGPMLSRWLPAADSLCVRARAGAERPRRRIVLYASLDAPQAGRIFTLAGAERLLGRSGPAQLAAPAGVHAWLWRGLLAACVATAAAALGADGALVGIARVLLALGLGALAALGYEWSRAEASPGANANASGVAALLTCGEQLLAQLRDDEELWLLLGGAHEPGACGVRAFLDDQETSFANGALFIELQRVGGAQPAWVRAEVGLERLVHPTRLPELARRVAESGAYGEIGAVDWVGTTGAAVAAERGLHALALVSLDAGGRPRGEGRADDEPSRLDMANVVRTADFAAAVAEASLRGESDPLAFV